MIGELLKRREELQNYNQKLEAYLQSEHNRHENQHKEILAILDVERQFRESVTRLLHAIEIKTSSGNVTLGNLVETNHGIDQKLKASEAMVRDLSSVVDDQGKEKNNMNFAFSNQLRQIEHMAQEKNSMELEMSRLASRLDRVERKKKKQKRTIEQLKEQVADLEGIVGGEEASEANLLTGDEDDEDDEGGIEEEDGEEQEDGNDGVGDDADEN
jgi:chromosome segregation ATPase